MNEITCRGCGKPESECTCNVPTNDTQIIKLQARIAELEALIPTKEEAGIVISLIQAAYYSSEFEQVEYRSLEDFINDNHKELYTKLQKIIDKRGCNED